MIKQTIPEIIKAAENNYQIGTTNLGEHVSFSMRETLEKIIAYLNSRHITGDKDALGRDKPFFNIVTAAVNIWYRATDLDRKDVVVKPTKGEHTVAAFLATIFLQDWMRRSNFGVFLNKWGRMLAQYGSAVVKFVVKDGELVPSVIPWNRIITDAVDFDALPRIEKLYKTPAQLKKMTEIDQDCVEELVNALVARKTTTTPTQKDILNDFVEIYEVHGELPLAHLEDEPMFADDKLWSTYRQQMHLVSMVKNKKNEYDTFTLYKGKESKDPYMLTHLIEEDGRVLSIGAVEHLFEAQWMTNHSIKNMKDTLDLASKMVFQTADGQFVGRNLLSSIETGDIFIHSANNPLTQVNTYKADITALQNFGAQWKALSQEITSTPDAMRGTTLPSGTPYSLGAYLGQQAGSLFEIMTENKGLALEEMLRRFVIPYIKTKLNTTEEIIAVLDDANIKKLDAMYIPNKAIKNYNRRTTDAILEGQIPAPFNQQAEEQAISQGMATMGNTRPIKPQLDGKDITWKEVFKDLEWNLEMAITNESTDKQAVMQTLSATFQTIAGFAGRLMTPDERIVFNKLMKETGTVSPVELSMVGNQQPTQANPQQGIENLAKVGKKL